MKDTSQKPFSIPLVFPTTYEPDSTLTSATIHHVLARSFTSSIPLILQPWGMKNPDASSEDTNGLILGCQDGTLFTFKPSRPSSPPPPIEIAPAEAIQLAKPPLKRKPRSSAKSSRRNSHSSGTHQLSLSLSSAAFPVTPRARVVSGVTTDPVEAPKNYVDFDDEPDKLKDILQGRTPRDRQSFAEASDRGSSNGGNGGNHRPSSLADTPIIGPAPAARRRTPPRSALNHPLYNSRPPTPASASIPHSPRDDISSNSDSSDSRSSSGRPYGSWVLGSHIIPPQSGSGRAVKAVEIVDDGEHLALLQESGDLFVLAIADGSCAAHVQVKDHFTGPRESGSLSSMEWIDLFHTSIGEKNVLVAAAAIHPIGAEADEALSEQCQCAAFELQFTPLGIELSFLASWQLQGPAKGAGAYTNDDKTTMFVINHAGHFLLHDVTPPTAQNPPTHLSSSPSNTSTHNGSHYSGTNTDTHLLLPNPFKAILPRSSEHLGEKDSSTRPPSPSPVPLKLVISEALDKGPLLNNGNLVGMRYFTPSNSVRGNLRGAVWGNYELTIFECYRGSLRVLNTSQIEWLSDVQWVNEETYALFYEEHVEIYRLTQVNPDGDSIKHSDSRDSIPPHSLTPILFQTIPLKDHQAIHFFQGGSLAVVRTNPQPHPSSSKVSAHLQKHKELVLFELDLDLGDRNVLPPNPGFQVSPPARILWRSDVSEPTGTPRLSSTLPLDFDTFVQGYSDGFLRRFILSQLARDTDPTSPQGFGASLGKPATASLASKSDLALPGQVTQLHIVVNPRKKERILVGGADDGSIAFWSFANLELLERWTVFLSPLSRVLQFPEETSTALKGCALCIAQDGTIAIVALEGPNFVAMVPGSPAPLERVCLGDSNLLLIYSDQRARLYDAKTKELWRSMSLDKAQELLAQGGWVDLSLDRDTCIPPTLWTPLPNPLHGTDGAATLMFNLERFILDAVAVTKTISGSLDEVRIILTTLDRLSLVLSMLITPGLSEDVDSICYGKLKLRRSNVEMGHSSQGCISLFQTPRAQDVWCISSVVTASRALAIIAVLRAMSLFEDLTDGANAVIAFYSSSLGAVIGSAFKPPSLEFLGRQWFEASVELRHSIRVLFDATVAALSDEEAIAITEEWQHYVPTLQPDSEKESTIAALALFICGSIASEKYSLLSTSALTDVSKSISLYLHDEKSSYRVLAIDLCSRGFYVWQHYINALEILRSLFELATTVKKEDISVQNVGAQARQAVLSIASSSTQLFVGTISLDILNPPTMEHRRSVLQIVAFLTRRRPHVLYPGLPRLLEAVVKSLDPNSTANRDLVLDSATEIIGYVVKTFPSVDFHGPTQRLAVGTNEGAVVMYDLKVAIRLYVLEGHKRPITALSFSPDGRRLITISLQDSSVLVWKVGSSFASFFNPGAPPRQGHGGSEPYKTLNFNIGAASHMTTEETLQLVKIEWAGERSARVKIRDSVLTFSAT